MLKYIAIAAVAASPAIAAPKCAPAPAMRMALASNGVPLIAKMENEQAQYEIYATEGGTWVVLVVKAPRLPAGNACVAAEGHIFEAVPGE